MHGETAAWLIAPLVMTGFSAAIAFITRRRAAFIGGALAAWFVANLPGPQIRGHYSSYEGAVMDSVHRTVERSWNTVPMAAVFGVIIGLVYSEFAARRRS